MYNVAGALAIGGAVVGAYSALRSADAQQDAARAQQEAARLAQRQADLANARQRREQIRARRIAAADNLSRGVASGITGSSTLAGVQGALNTTFASNLSYLDAQADLGRQRTSFLNAVTNRSSQSNIFSALSSLGFTTSARAFNTYQNTTQYIDLVRAIES